MKKILPAILPLLILSCSPIIINQNNHFNIQDREYISSKITGAMKCLSYYLKDCKEKKISIEFILNKNGKTKDVIVLNKALLNSEFSNQIKMYFRDSCNDFREIKINRERKFRFEFNFKESSNSPCGHCGGGLI